MFELALEVSLFKFQ